jgi:hypothetical protein
MCIKEKLTLWHSGPLGHAQGFDILVFLTTVPECHFLSLALWPQIDTLGALWEARDYDSAVFFAAAAAVPDWRACRLHPVHHS